MHARPLRGLLAVLCAGLAFAQPCAAGSSSEGRVGVQVVDDAGRDVRLAVPAARIVSLSPHATELLYAIGVGDRLVAVERNSDHPPEARALPKIAALPRPDPERVLAAAPDLVVVWGPGGATDLIARLERLGIAAYVSDPRSLDAIADTVARLGTLAGVSPRAEALKAVLRQRIAALRLRYASAQPVPVFVQVWSRPLMTLSDRDLIGDALRACGAHNVFGNLPRAAAEVGPEAALARGPQAILAFDGEVGRAGWKSLGVLAPEGPITFVLADPALARPTPRAVDALEAVCAALDRLRSRR